MKSGNFSKITILISGLKRDWRKGSERLKDRPRLWIILFVLWLIITGRITEWIELKFLFSLDLFWSQLLNFINDLLNWFVFTPVLFLTELLRTTLGWLILNKDALRDTAILSIVLSRVFLVVDELFPRTRRDKIAEKTTEEQLSKTNEEGTIFLRFLHEILDWLNVSLYYRKIIDSCEMLAFMIATFTTHLIKNRSLLKSVRQVRKIDPRKPEPIPDEKRNTFFVKFGREIGYTISGVLMWGFIRTLGYIVNLFNTRCLHDIPLINMRRLYAKKFFIVLVCLIVAAISFLLTFSNIGLKLLSRIFA